MADERDYQGDWDLPVDPDTDAAGPRGYGNEGLDHDVLPNEYQGDNDSEVSDNEHNPNDMADLDDGMANTHLNTYDKEQDGQDDFDVWRDLGFDLGGF